MRECCNGAWSRYIAAVYATFAGILALSVIFGKSIWIKVEPQTILIQATQQVTVNNSTTIDRLIH
jgi:hypothetical protein